MKRKIALGLVLIMLISLFPKYNFSLASTEVALAAGTSLGTLTDVQGEVYVQIGGGIREFIGRSGMALTQGDSVQTDKNSSATITFTTGTKLTLGPSTIITLSKMIQTKDSGMKVSIRLKSGSIWSNVKSLINSEDEYKIETASAVMEARGTLFLVAADADSRGTRTSVIEGAIGVYQHPGSVDQSSQFLPMGTSMSVPPPLSEWQATRPAAPQAAPQAPVPSGAIDMTDIISSEDPSILASMAIDMVERMQELYQQSQSYLSGYQSSHNSDYLYASLQFSQISVRMAELSEQFMSLFQGDSEREQELREEFKRYKTTTDDLKQQVQKMLDDMQQMAEDAVRIAHEAGIDSDEVDRVMQNAPTAAFGAGIGSSPVIPAPPTPAAPTPPTYIEVDTPSPSNPGTQPVLTGLSSIGNILGIARVGEELWAGQLEPAEATVTYQWMRSDTEEQDYEDIEGATSDRYLLSEEDKGKFIRVRAIAYGEYTGTIISAPLGKVEGTQPVQTELISIGDIVGDARVGEIVRAGQLDPAETTVTYQWMRSDTEEQGYEEIEGATSEYYQLLDEDEGKFIRVKVIAYGDYSGTIISAPLGKVEAKIPIPTN